MDLNYGSISTILVTKRITGMNRMCGSEESDRSPEESGRVLFYKGGQIRLGQQNLKRGYVFL